MKDVKILQCLIHLNILLVLTMRYQSFEVVCGKLYVYVYWKSSSPKQLERHFSKLSLESHSVDFDFYFQLTTCFFPKPLLSASKLAMKIEFFFPKPLERQRNLFSEQLASMLSNSVSL